MGRSPSGRSRVDSDARYWAMRADVVRPDDVADDAVLRVLRVPPELAGMRLDRFVATQLRATSRTRSQKIIERSVYRVDGTHLKKNHRVSAEERVILWRPPWDEETPDVELSFVHEDDDLLVVNKPPNLTVHPTARHHKSTVTMILAEQRPEERLTLVHRLDRETSGVLIVARSREADRGCKVQIERRKNVEKRYLAITWGWPPWDRITREVPLEPCPVSRYRVKMREAEPGTGMESATSFEVLERRRRGDRRYALVECHLHTGRQHQIRVHLSGLGFPILGDKLYGPDEHLFARGADGELTDEDRAILEIDRQALHAAKMTLEHPTQGGRLVLEAPLFEDLQRFWDGLDEA